MDIVYQDERIVVAIKPAGVISTDVRNGMPELLRRQLHTDCIRTVHRLDAPVSGLMVFARSSRAAADTLAHATVFRNASYCRSVTHGTSLSEMLLIK